MSKKAPARANAIAGFNLTHFKQEFGVLLGLNYYFLLAFYTFYSSSIHSADEDLAVRHYVMSIILNIKTNICALKGN